MKTSVRHHVRRTPSGGVTGVVRHDRTLGDHATRTTTFYEINPAYADKKPSEWPKNGGPVWIKKNEEEPIATKFIKATRGGHLFDLGADDRRFIPVNKDGVRIDATDEYPAYFVNKQNGKKYRFSYDKDGFILVSK